MYSDDSEEEDQADERWKVTQAKAHALLRSAFAADPERKHFQALETFFFQFAAASSPTDALALLNFALVRQVMWLFHGSGFDRHSLLLLQEILLLLLLLRTWADLGSGCHGFGT